MRQLVFRIGMSTLAFALIATMISWAHPFSLTADGHGGYSDERNFFAGIAALLISLIGCALVLYGKGTARSIAFVVGLLLFVAAYIGLLSNGH